MGDSDEEYDRRRRDKFRGERNDYDNRRPPPRGYDRGRGSDRRGGHENTWENRGSKRDYYGRDQGNRDRRENFGRGSSPPSKKSRGRDWESNEQQAWRGGPQESNVLVPVDKSATSSVPTLMSFKDFILQQEDDIDETESVRRYQEYKVEFKRTQINDFFVLHKGEEWFKEKYHPIESVTRKRFLLQGLRKRLRIFLNLWEAGYMDNVNLHINNTGDVLKILDRVILKLEGHSDEDIKVLDYPPAIEKTEAEDDTKTDSQDPSKDKKEEEAKEEPKPYSYEADGIDDEDGKEPLPPGMEDDEDLVPPGMEDGDKRAVKKEDEDERMEDDGKNEKDESSEDKKVEEKKYIYDGAHLKRPVSFFMRSIPANVTRNDLIGVCKRYPGFLRIALSEPSPERRYYRRAWSTFDSTVNIKDICWNLNNIRVKDVELNTVVNRDVTNRVRPVNGVTCSPMAAQLDIKLAIKLLKRFDDKHQLYSKNETNGHTAVDKKEKDEEADAAKIEVKEEDTVKEEIKEEEEEEISLPDENPIFLHLPENITNLISGLEIEDEEDGQKEYAIVPNEELNKALDLVLLYLRIVHCLDFYNGNEYLHEDEMPVRCGIMHVRGPPLEAASKNDVYEWYNQNSSKMEHVLKDEEIATDEEAEKLGKKIEETEVENFIKANTQELAKDKWLCPLSGKKFRGPDFIRKHILMKHNENVEEVKMEVMFFNNYIYDMKRPCFPEAKPRTTGSAGTGTPQSNSSTVVAGAVANSGGRSWTSASRQPVMFATPKPPYQNSVYQQSTPQSSAATETYGRMHTYPPKQRRGGFRDRKVIKYRDLDAPEESDFF